MRRLFEALAGDGRHRDFLVWGGVGDGSFIGAARALGARHALYIEPHDGLRERLLARHALADNERLSDRPLWRARGPVVFHVTNDASSSSLVPPVEGQGARRNIRVVDERSVEADSIDSALETLPAEGRAGLLVLDAGGAEALIVEGASAGALSRFDTIVVPARDRERVGARLADRGFDAQRTVHDEHGNEWAVFAARAATDPPEVERLRSELQERQDEVDALRARLEALAGELEASHAARAESEAAAGTRHAEALEALQSEHARAVQALQAEHGGIVEALRAEHARAVEAMQAEHAGVVDALKSGHAGALEALAAARDAATAALSERGAEAETLRAQLAASAEQAAQAATDLAAERDAQAGRAADLQQKLTDFSHEAEQTIAALTRERDTANAALVEANATIARLEQELDRERTRAEGLDSRLAGLEQQLVEARQVSALSVKLQAQRDADLADLQARYRESQDAQARQRELLEKLGARLSVASHYFHQLADGRARGGREDEATPDALQADFDGDPR